MRTFLVGLFGGGLVFAFFFLTGAVGDIDLGFVKLERPASADRLNDRLAEWQSEARAVGVEGWTPPPKDQARFFKQQIIAQPRAVSSAAGLGNLEAMASPMAVGGPPLDAERAAIAMANQAAADRARRTALEFGQVTTSGGGSFVVKLDTAASPAATAPRGVRGGEAAAVQPMSMMARAAAARAKLTTGPEEAIAVDTGIGCREGSVGGENEVECAIERLRSVRLEDGEPMFAYVEKNFIATHEMEPGGLAVYARPNDPLYALQWHYRAQGTGADQSPGGAGFEAFWAQPDGKGHDSVIVAVIDTGLDLEHPDIINSPNIVPGVDMVSVPFYANDGDGRDLDPSDPGDVCDPNSGGEPSYHGTHVAGTIGAVSTDNGDGVAGGAWNVTIVPVRALGRCGGLQSDINDAIRWAAGVEPTIVETPEGPILFENEYPADIINLSLGFRAPNGCPASTQAAIDDARARGAILVVAAGNAATDVSGYAPSGCEGVISVAAADAMGRLAPYSNYGAGIDIMAPGGDMTADTNGDGLPDGVLSTKRKRTCIDPVTRESKTDCPYSFENGTSMAAPHVTAALALLSGNNARLTDSQLERIIVDVARSELTAGQCSGPCADMPAAARVPVEGQPGLCERACGAGLLDLGRQVRR